MAVRYGAQESYGITIEMIRPVLGLMVEILAKDQSTNM